MKGTGPNAEGSRFGGSDAQNTQGSPFQGQGSGSGAGQGFGPRSGTLLHNLDKHHLLCKNQIEIEVNQSMLF